MYSKQVMYSLWSVLVFVRILPSFRPSCFNRLALLIWMVIISLIGAVTTFHELIWNGKDYSRSFSSKFSLICFCVFVPLEANVVLYQIQKFTKKLEVDVKTWMMYPERLWLYMLCLGFNLVVNIHLYEYVYEVPELWYVIFVGLSGVILPLPMLGVDLTVGCFAKQFCQQVKEHFCLASLETVNIIYVPILSQYQAAKENLGHLLLAVFTIESILLTNTGYYVTKNPSISLISLFLYTILHLSYISLVLDDCCSLLKSVLPSLR